MTITHDRVEAVLSVSSDRFSIYKLMSSVPKQVNVFGHACTKVQWRLLPN